MVDEAYILDKSTAKVPKSGEIKQEILFMKQILSIIKDMAETGLHLYWIHLNSIGTKLMNDAVEGQVTSAASTASLKALIVKIESGRDKSFLSMGKPEHVIHTQLKVQ